MTARDSERKHIGAFMNRKKEDRQSQAAKHPTQAERASHGRILAVPDRDKNLDTLALHRLEQAFRAWVDASPRASVRLSRQRILLIFLIIRYTGAKLNEVLGLDPRKDIDVENHSVGFGRAKAGGELPPRQVQLPQAICEEIGAILSCPEAQKQKSGLFKIDPGFVRRKFYERAAACGFPKHLGAPEVLRKSRAIELMQNDMPLPAVQMMLGHSTPNLTSAYVSFSEEEIQQVTRRIIDREATRKTSARNAFYGKIETIRRGDIQSQIDLATLSGFRVVAVITNDSLERLALKKGKLMTAEVKAPWIILYKGDLPPASSAENRCEGVIAAIHTGTINTEYIVRVADGTELCAVVATSRSQALGFAPGDRVWAMFTCFAVVLHAE
jgi:molybdate transport system regulatory protein